MSNRELTKKDIAVPPDGTSTLIKPKERILAFDFARGIAIVLMVLIHTAVFIGGHDLINTSTGYFVNSIVCILAAPVFMFVMGLLFAMSSKATFGVQLSRGFLILLLGYVLNFFRGTLPIWLGMVFGWIDDDLPWDYILEDDILQFAGLALITMALVKRTIPWSIGWLIVGFVAAFISPFVWDKGSDTPFVNYLMSLFSGGEEYNFFPFFPWIAFPLIGMAYGDFFKKATNKAAFFNKGALIGIIIILCGVSINHFYKMNIWEDWYLGKFRQGQLPIPVVVIFTGFQFLWLPFCHLITTRIKNNKTFDLLYFWSKNVTAFYVIQWIIIGFVCIILIEIGWPAVILFTFLITFFTDRLIRYYLNVKQKKQVT